MLLAFTALVFLPTLRGGYIWDDEAITRNALILDPGGIRGIWLHPTANMMEKHYWPVVYTTFWLEARLWGFVPGASRAINLLLHLANVALAWQLARRLGARTPLIVAALFAVHPLRVESVSWIIERKDLLSGLFYLTAFAAFDRFRKGAGWGALAACAACFTLALLSKSIAVTLPAALLLAMALDARARKPPPIEIRRGIFGIAVLGVIGLVCLAGDAALTRYYEGTGDADSDGWAAYSLLNRVGLASRAWLFYGFKSFWPSLLSPVYARWAVPAPALAVVICSVLFAGMCAMAAWILWRARAHARRLAAFGVLMFTLTLLPVLGFVPHGYMAIAFTADRHTYLAGFGIALAISELVYPVILRLPRIGTPRRAAGLAFALLGLLTFRQTLFYRDSLAFWSHASDASPGHWYATHNLGATLLTSGDAEAARRLHESALAANPELDLAHADLARLLAREGDLAGAIEHYETALAINPRSWQAETGLGLALLKARRPAEAEPHITRALELKPHDAEVHLAMALFHASRGNINEAEREAKEGLRIDARSTDGALLLARIYQASNRLDDARKVLEDAAKWAPKQAEPHAQLGRTLAAQGRNQEATVAYERALALDPNNAVALTGLGVERADQGRLDEAEELLRRATQADPMSGEAFSNLGILLARRGKMEEARASFTRALEINPADADAARNLRRTGAANP